MRLETVTQPVIENNALDADLPITLFLKSRLIGGGPINAVVFVYVS